MCITGFSGASGFIRQIAVLVVFTMVTKHLSTGQEALKAAPGASMSLVVTAVLPSQVQLDSELLAFIVAAEDANEGAKKDVDSSLTMAWNVDSLVQRVQLIGYFLHSADAAYDDLGNSVEAAQLEVSVDGSDWKAFPKRLDSNQPSGIILDSRSIGQSGPQGKRVYRLKVRVRQAEGLATPSLYRGVLHFRAVMQ